MEEYRGAAEIQKILGCGERTAVSVQRTLLAAGIPDIAEVTEAEKSAYTVLRVVSSDGKAYYAFIGLGFFLESVRADSMDGESIYSAME